MQGELPDELLVQRQIEIEEQAADASLIKGWQFRDKALQEAQAMRLAPVQSIVQAAYSTAEAALTEELQQRCAGVGAKYRQYLRIVGADKCVSIALRTLMNYCFADHAYSMQAVLKEIGKAIEAELYIAEIQKVAPLQVEHAEEYLDKGKVRSLTLRSNAFHAALKYIGQGDRERWDSNTVIQTAKLAVEAAFSTGLFEWRRHAQTQLYELYPSLELAEHWEGIADNVRPVVQYLPMIVPPCKWEGLYTGGYYTAWYREHAPACTFRHIPKKYRERLQGQYSSESTAKVREVMNAAQEVPYRINHKVLRCLQNALAQGNGCMGLSRTNPAPMPEFPFNEDWNSQHCTEAEQALFKAWKHSMREWHVTEHLRRSRSHSVLSAIQVMLQFRDYQRIYFPVFLDWRGRLYYRGVLNPQAQDSIKGVLEFADGKELGTQGLYWLRVHIANCCGYDKTNFDGRAKWVQEQEQDLRNWYDNCLEQDAPDTSLSFQLYAALNAYFEALDSGSPETYKCHVPVAMDATCSGLQHYSTMLRDPVGAKFVNCYTSSTEAKEDIYKEVATRAMQKLPSYCNEVQELYWKELVIPRSMAKKPVMTFVYGSTLSSSIDYVAEDMQKQGYEGIRDTATGELLVHQGQLAVPVAKALRAAVEETVPAAAAMMDYLKAAVRCSSEPLEWVTPMGLRVMNWVDKQLISTIKIRSMGVEQILMHKHTDELDMHKAVNGIAPNFVHSMDACHLQLTVLHFKKPMLLVHDSFACYPSDCTAMHYSIRESFYKLYSNPIADLIAEYNPQVQETLRTSGQHRPSDGTFELKEVLDSYFLFC